jgi:hypothetical protein
MKRGVVLRCLLCSLLASFLWGIMIAIHAQDLAPLQSPSAPTESVAPAPAEPAKRKRIVYKEKTYLDFEDTIVNGNLRAPDGSFVFRKNQSSFSSSLNLKRSFIPELKTSAQDAK